jgi:hypothetical protein
MRLDGLRRAAHESTRPALKPLHPAISRLARHVEILKSRLKFQLRYLGPYSDALHPAILLPAGLDRAIWKSVISTGAY